MNHLQRAVASHAGIDAWVLYDFRKSNPLAWHMLDLDAETHCTRRWLVVIPAHGRIQKVVHKLETHTLAHVEAVEHTYATYQEYDAVLRTILGTYETVAMEYSPMNALPVTSYVDAGTIEHVRSLGVNVVSSANLAQQFTAVLTDQQRAGAALAGAELRAVIIDAFRLIATRLLDAEPVSELDVQQYILEQFAVRGMITDAAPIVAIGPNAANPHYAPSFTQSSMIGSNMVVLIDAWAKYDAPGSVYADLTWVGYTADLVPEDIANTFDVILRARDAALDLVTSRYTAGQDVAGCEVDRAARSVVDHAGLGHYFIHRTGHNITTVTHGPGTNMDDFETQDTRLVLPGTSFSIEPGVYIPGVVGLRTEIDVIVQSDGTVDVPSSPLQTRMIPLLATEWDV